MIDVSFVDEGEYIDELKRLLEATSRFAKATEESATMTFQTGLEKTKSVGGFTPGESLFFKPKAGETVDIMCLAGPDGFYRCLMHEHWDRMRETPPQQVIFTVCTAEPDCPGCLLDNTPQQRGYLPVLFSEKNDDGSPKVKILTMTKTMVDQFIEGADLVDDDIKGRIIRVKRVGKTKTDTKYNVLVTGKKPDKFPSVDLPDIPKAIGPINREEIVEKYAKFGVAVPGESVSSATTDTYGTWVSTDDVPEDEVETEVSMWADV